MLAEKRLSEKTMGIRIFTTKSKAPFAPVTEIMSQTAAGLDLYIKSGTPLEGYVRQVMRIRRRPDTPASAGMRIS